MRIANTLVPAVLIASLFPILSYAATSDRISGAVDPSNVVVLKGHVTAMAQPQFDQGPVESSRAMNVTMLFMPTAQQDQALVKLLAEQQDVKSPNFHKWLTVPQYADQFGLSQGDIEKISAWLLAQGFKITYVANGRDFLSFQGTAGQVQSVFKTEIHNFNVNGKMHFANVTAPAIPAALSGIVGGFRGLHDFFPRSMAKKRPNFTFAAGGGEYTVLAPGDIATIYDIKPLYTDSINGAGQTVVIVGQTDVYLADLNYFRSDLGLSSFTGCTVDSNNIVRAGACTSGNFQMIVPGDGSDPGISSGDLSESDLDIETLGGVARNAQIIFVTSGALSGVDDSASWAVDQNPPLAQVISYSYGLCESLVNAPGIAASEVVYKKAAGLGISFFAASGDAASATCDGYFGDSVAVLGQSVSYPASSAYVTGVGGTEFDEVRGGGTYWGNSSQNDTNGGSALSYIPEIGWNDTNPYGAPDGSGGGPSNCAFGSGLTNVNIDGFEYSFQDCAAPPGGGFPKPSWQVGTGVPADGVRDVPDIAFSASNYNDPYIVCTPQSELASGAPTTSSCTVSISDALATYNSAFGGTSASTPVAAGMAVLLNQKLGTNGLGLLNPQLYKLYGSNSSAFHVMGTGASSTVSGAYSNNIVSCTANTPSFEPPALQCPSSDEIGYAVATGYNEVTGLGSIDFNALFSVWSASRTASTTALASSASGSVAPGTSVTFTATVTTASVSPTGTVSFFDNSSTTALGSVLVQNGTAAFTTTALPGGANSVVASYLGDAVNGTSASSATVVTVIQPDFSVGSSASSTTVVAGHTSSPITVTITPVNGFNSQVSFSCSGQPTGVTCTASPVTPNGTAAITTSLTISAAASTMAGTYSLTLTASGGGVSHALLQPISLTVSSTDQSFTLAPQNGTYQVKQGTSATVNITLTPANGFNTPLIYTCSDTASESACTGPNGATVATSVSFSVTTTAPTALLVRPLNRGTKIFYAALLPGLLGIMFTVGSRRRFSPGKQRGMRLLGLIFMLAFSTLWLGSCSGSSGGTSNPGTPTGNYTITVNASTGGSNPVSGQTTFILNVVQ